MPRTLVLLLVVAVAGCGARSGSAAKQAYLVKAEAICAKAITERNAVAAPAGAADFQPYVHALIDIASRTATTVGALTPPKADASALQAKVIGPLQEQLRDGRRYAAKVDAATASHNTVALLTLAGNPPKTTRADLGYMRTYGFKACAKAADTAG